MNKDRSQPRNDAFGLQLTLLLGPTDGGWDGEWTLSQLRRGWHVYRRELTEHSESISPAGTRPWAWWVFDRGFEAEPCEAEAVAYLAEHGLLTDRERQQLGH